MIIITNTIHLKKGHAHELIERFSTSRIMEHQKGLITLHLLQTRGVEEHDELLVHSVWESKEAHDRWVHSEDFKKSHSGPKLESLIDFKIRIYDVVGEKLPFICKDSVNN